MGLVFCVPCTEPDPELGTLRGQKQQTFAIIKPDAFAQSDDILQEITDSGLIVVQSRTMKLTPEQASLFYVQHKGKPFYNDAINHLSSGKIYVLILECVNAVQKWKDLMGSNESPKSIRAIYGTNAIKNAVHGSDSIEEAQREIGFFFD
eukprot:487314_1